MKPYLVFIGAIAIVRITLAQEVFPTQFSSFCEGNIYLEGKYLQERINRIYKQNGRWRIDATIIDDCGIKLYPECRMMEDTLFINTYAIEWQKNVLENGDAVYEQSQEEECYCAYLLRLEFSLDTLFNIKINNKNLPVTDEVFQTFDIKYFIHDGDTTGYQDKYGLRQGYMVFKNSAGVFRQYYKDGEFIYCEFYDRNGIVIKKSGDCLEILEATREKK